LCGSAHLSITDKKGVFGGVSNKYREEGKTNFVHSSFSSPLHHSAISTMSYTKSMKSGTLKDRMDEQQQTIGRLIEHEKLQGSILGKIIADQQATINDLKKQQQTQHQLIGMIMGQLEQQRQETLHSRSKRRDVVIDRSPFPPYNHPTNPALRRNPHTPAACRDEGGALKRHKPIRGRPTYRSINSRPKAGGMSSSSRRRIDSDTNHTDSRGTTSSSRSGQTDDQEPTTRYAYSPRSMALEEEEIYGYIKSPKLMVLLSEFGKYRGSYDAWGRVLTVNSVVI
jgi:hypothetical protein